MFFVKKYDSFKETLDEKDLEITFSCWSCVVYWGM